MNNISPTQVVAAASDVWRGRAVSLAAPIESEVALDNPALTAMAHAIRVGDHILERLGWAGDEGSQPVTGKPGGPKSVGTTGFSSSTLFRW